ncbi:citrate utilisation protein B [Citrobacter freundii]|nr:citrate utilisation protein B [Citrobacter freundii]
MKQLEQLIIAAQIITEPEAEVERVMQVCNACRYCEGFCAVFPAMTQRLEFGKADINYLANLCHNCGACLHACQYAPPMNLPSTYRKRWRKCGSKPISTTRTPPPLARFIVAQASP